MTDEQKNYYVDNICKLCNKQDICNKDKFTAVTIYDKLSIKCLNYEFNKII